jgi:hypothetical protein
MLADIRREAPCRQLLCRIAAKADFWRILNKLYMPPRGMTDSHGVVVRKSAPLITIRTKLVPLFARNLACFAADAQS